MPSIPTGNQRTVQGPNPASRSYGSTGTTPVASPSRGGVSTTPPESPPGRIGLLSRSQQTTSSSGGVGPRPTTPLTQILSSMPVDQRNTVTMLAAKMASERLATLSASGSLGTPASHAQAKAASAANTKPAKRIMRESDEVTMSTIERPVSIPDEIRGLFQEAMYLPIHLFTRANLRLIAEQRSTLTKKHRIVELNTNITLLDVTHPSLGKEADLSLILWIEAWAHYTIFLREVAESAVVARWRRHFEALCNHEDRETAFPALLAFDIAERRAYNEQQFTHDESRWHIRLGREIGKFRAVEFNQRLQDITRFTPRDFGSASRDRAGPSSSSSSRFTPYSKDGSSSFQTGKPRSSAGGICLICGRSGHFARSCITKSTPNNKPVITRFDKQLPHALVGIRDDKQQFCVAFNAGGPEKCRPGNHGTKVKHMCSLCGDEQHFAATCPSLV